MAVPVILESARPPPGLTRQNTGMLHSRNSGIHWQVDVLTASATASGTDRLFTSSSTFRADPPDSEHQSARLGLGVPEDQCQLELELEVQLEVEHLILQILLNLLAVVPTWSLSHLH